MSTLTESKGYQDALKEGLEAVAKTVEVAAADPGKSGLAMAKLVHPRADIIVQRTRPA